MPQLTMTELWWCDECIKGTALMVKKLGALAQISNDPQLRNICHTLRQNHQRHLDILVNQIASV
ncbi:MAG: hypothetical protein AB1445_04465 [Bacillota bacterium]